MSRQRLLETAESAVQRMQGAAAQFGEAFATFRESRLYVQIILSGIMVAGAGLVSVVPVGPLAQAKAAATWVATSDYDFKGTALGLNGWARERGGWTRAMSGLMAAGVERAKTWVELPETAPSASPPQQQEEAQPRPQATPPLSQPAPTAPAESPRAAAKPVMPVSGTVLYEFGWPPPGGGDLFHHGIDLVAKAGTPVIAVADGTVMKVLHDEKLGQVVEIRHGNMLGVYAQVDGVLVKAGQQVRQSDPIATVGSPSGLEKSLPPHVHFEVRIWPDRNSVDPASYLGLGGRKL